MKITRIKLSGVNTPPLFGRCIGHITCGQRFCFWIYQLPIPRGFSAEMPQPEILIAMREWGACFCSNNDEGVRREFTENHKLIEFRLEREAILIQESHLLPIKQSIKHVLSNIRRILPPTINQDYEWEELWNM